jgi:aquaporin Z
MEGAELGIFMVSACLFTALLHYPGSPLVQAVPDLTARRVLTGIAMGLTAISIVYSPWGKQSGAHFNPSFTLTFFRLGKIDARDAGFYAIAQFIGAVLGVLASVWLIGKGIVGHPSVNFVATVGSYGPAVAFAGEVVISFLQMTAVLKLTNHPRLARFTGLFAGALVATYISLEAPLSGMSMNPARSFGSAFPAQLWTGLWIYFTAPPIGMLLAAEVYLRRKGRAGIICAKMHHQNNKRCIFCEYHRRPEDRSEGVPVQAAAVS